MQKVKNMDTAAATATGKPLEERLETVSLKDIYMDVAIQTRDEMCSKTVRGYEVAYRNGAKFPPPLVTERQGELGGFASFVLLDGFHRVQALQNIRYEQVEVRVVTTPKEATYKELRWIGGRENIQNGLALKPKDKRVLNCIEI